MIIDWLKPLIGRDDLWSAARRNDVPAICKLVEAGADVNGRGRIWGNAEATPLHLAARHGCVAAVRELIRLGAKVDSKDAYGATPLMSAVSEDGDCETLEALLDAGGNIEERDASGSAVLEMAVFRDDVELFRLLLRRGANPDGPKKPTVTSPLDTAASQGKLHLVEALLEAGASVNSAPGKDVPIGSAAVFGHLAIVERLIAAKADVNQPDSSTRTPLMCAVRSGKKEVVATILKAGADVNYVAEDGQTALDLAVEDKADEIVQLLEQAGGKQSAGK